MHIYWFTGRSLDDLCSTTQTSLASGLIEKGHTVTIVNPDKMGTHQSWPWKHQSIPLDTLPGFRARTLGKKMVKWLATINIHSECVMLVDWRVAGILIPKFEKKRIPWVLIDRSPPADKGILSFLQWPSWKKSWKFVRDAGFGTGCVVSQMHRKFVQDKIGIEESSISILPAGVDLQRFNKGQRFEITTMVYHGRLDRNRGILALPMLLRKAKNAGINARLILIGNGDCFDRIVTMAQINEDMEVYPTMNQEKLAEVLAQCHIGLLPMPDKKVWTLASPLKRSEYAASGLAIFGIDHEGHRFDDQNQIKWMTLVKQFDFHEKGVKLLKNFSHERMLSLSDEARMYAEEHLAWEHTIDILENAILSIHAKHS